MIDRFGYGRRSRFGLLVGDGASLMGGIQGGGMKALSARFPERQLVVARQSRCSRSASRACRSAPTVAVLLVAARALPPSGARSLQPSL